MGHKVARGRPNYFGGGAVQFVLGGKVGQGTKNATRGGVSKKILYLTTPVHKERK